MRQFNVSRCETWRRVGFTESAVQLNLPRLINGERAGSRSRREYVRAERNNQLDEHRARLVAVAPQLKVDPCLEGGQRGRRGQLAGQIRVTTYSRSSPRGRLITAAGPITTGPVCILADITPRVFLH